MAKFIVWDVFGYSRGNVKHLATFAYACATDAHKFATSVPGGYVMRSNVERRTAPQPRVDHNTPDANATDATATVAVPIVAVRSEGEVKPSERTRFHTFATG
jgi:hypothetical protein